MVLARVWALFSAICSKVSLFSVSSFKVSFQNATVVIPRLWALLSAIWPIVSLFFLLQFQGWLLEYQNGDSWSLGPIFCYLTARPWAERGSRFTRGLLLFFFLSVTRPKLPLGQILSHATCDVYSVKAVKTLIPGQFYGYCFLFCG